VDGNIANRHMGTITSDLLGAELPGTTHIHPNRDGGAKHHSVRLPNDGMVHCGSPSADNKRQYKRREVMYVINGNKVERVHSMTRLQGILQGYPDGSMFKYSGVRSGHVVIKVITKDDVVNKSVHTAKTII